MQSDTSPVHTTNLRGLEKIHTGKVRDIYAVDAGTMLIVTTDRLSAFDVVMPDPIPGKGRVLNEISLFWFARTAHLVANHLTHRNLDSLPLSAGERAMLTGRAVLVRRLKALPLEAVVRGYLIGSGWKDYQQTGAICGRQAAATYFHAGDQGGRRRARRECVLRGHRRRDRRGAGGGGALGRATAVRICP
jgi:phosphoribosylaminoimidazole-succinocarboxamide synthase